MLELPIVLHDGHTIALARGRRLLVDTGSPLSFATDGQIEWTGSRSVARSFLGLAPRSCPIPSALRSTG
jgi:hypothetical protein